MSSCYIIPRIAVSRAWLSKWYNFVSPVISWHLYLRFTKFHYPLLVLKSMIVINNEQILSQMQSHGLEYVKP